MFYTVWFYSSQLVGISYTMMSLTVGSDRTRILGRQDHEADDIDADCDINSEDDQGEYGDPCMTNAPKAPCCSWISAVSLAYHGSGYPVAI